jgi:hypothetical protein
MMGGLWAALFYILVSVFSEGAEREHRGKVITLAIAIVVVFMGFGSMAAPYAIRLVVMAAIAGVFAALLHGWLKLTWQQAGKIVGSYYAIVVGYALLWSVLFHGLR